MKKLTDMFGSIAKPIKYGVFASAFSLVSVLCAESANQINLKIFDQSVSGDKYQLSFGDRLLVGQRLEPGQYLKSKNGEYYLHLDDQGNLLFKDRKQERLIFENSDQATVSSLVLDETGNLILRSNTGNILWQTSSPNFQSEHLKVWDEGVVSLGSEQTKNWSIKLNSEIETEFDGGIMVPERNRLELIIFKGGTSKRERDWNDQGNRLWSKNLKSTKGVPKSERAAYKKIWRGSNSINDVKRVIHNDKIHLVVTGNGGDALAMYDFNSKRNIFWTRTSSTSPHDVEYIPLKNGYLVVANARGSKSYLELYDIRKNNRGRISGSVIKHAGVHSVHWDAEQKVLWAWGSSNENALKAYRVVFSDGTPKLKRLKKTFPVDIPGFKVGTGHGGSPMIANGRRYLILAGYSGILRFDTRSHEWKVIEWAKDNKTFKNPKGLSFNPYTQEIIVAKSNNAIYSTKNNVGTRELKNAEIYKARWWYHNYFSYE
ncbi:MAG: hypothetical protein HWE27_03290 [Gammaproteobacteria bacterium]|nr:hypothetical protein [Gammaproteobacteria bacterium]